jgi:hypothetical protein
MISSFSLFGLIHIASAYFHGEHGCITEAPSLPPALLACAEGTREGGGAVWSSMVVEVEPVHAAPAGSRLEAVLDTEFADVLPNGEPQHVRAMVVRSSWRVYRPITFVLLL